MDSIKSFEVPTQQRDPPTEGRGNLRKKIFAKCKSDNIQNILEPQFSCQKTACLKTGNELESVLLMRRRRHTEKMPDLIMLRKIQLKNYRITSYNF